MQEHLKRLVKTTRSMQGDVDDDTPVHGLELNHDQFWIEHRQCGLQIYNDIPLPKGGNLNIFRNFNKYLLGKFHLSLV